MISDTLTGGQRRALLLRKLLWLLVLTTLSVASLIIIPRVATPAPAVDSKLLALRVLFGIILFVGALSWRRIISQSWQLTDTIFAGLLASFTLSLLFSGRIKYGLSEFWHMGGFFCIGWLIFRLRPTAAECLALARVGGCLGLIAALYGFLVYIGKDILHAWYPFEFATNQGGRNFIHSFFGNPEYFGGYAAPTATLLLGLGFSPRIALWKRSLWILGAAFIMGVLLLSGSRGAVFGFVIGALIIFLGQVRLLEPKLRKISWALVGLGAVAMTAGLIILSTPNPLNPRDMRLAQRFTQLFNTTSASTRERILFYTSTAMAIPQNPVFGFGPGSYRLEFYNNVKLLVEKDPHAGTTVLLNQLNRRLAEHTHNDYLEFWFEQGTIGIALLLLLIVHAAVRFVRTRRHLRVSPKDSEATSLALLVTLFAGVTTLLVNALTSFPLHLPARGILAWVLIGSFLGFERVISEAAPASAGNLTRANQTISKDEG